MISKVDIIKYSQLEWKSMKSTTHSRTGTAVKRNVLPWLCHCSSQQKKRAGRVGADCFGDSHAGRFLPVHNFRMQIQKL